MKTKTTWMLHLEKVRKENPKLRLSECMKKAKLTYKK